MQGHTGETPPLLQSSFGSACHGKYRIVHPWSVQSLAWRYQNESRIMHTQDVSGRTRVYNTGLTPARLHVLTEIELRKCERTRQSRRTRNSTAKVSLKSEFGDFALSEHEPPFGCGKFISWRDDKVRTPCCGRTKPSCVPRTIYAVKNEHFPPHKRGAPRTWENWESFWLNQVSQR